MSAKIDRMCADHSIARAEERTRLIEGDNLRGGGSACVACVYWRYVEGEGCPVTDEHGKLVVEGEDARFHVLAWGKCVRYPKVQETSPDSTVEWVFPAMDYCESCGEFVGA